MSTIPTNLTEEQFNEYINPYLSKAKRDFVCIIPLYKVFNYILYCLHTGRQWERIPIDADPQELQKEKSVGKQCISTFESGARMAACSEYGKGVSLLFSIYWTYLNSTWMISHAIAKKGGESVAYKGRKKAKTINILPITEAIGFIIASTG